MSIWLWLHANKEALSLVISAAAFLISAGTFTRSWLKDKREREQKEAKERADRLPVIASTVERADRQSLFVPLEESRPEGWTFYIHLVIENRFGAPCIIDCLSAESKMGRIRLFQPVGPNLKQVEGFGSLVGDRSRAYFKPTPPGAKMLLSFHLHLEIKRTKAEIEAGLPITTKLAFDIQTGTPHVETIEHGIILRPGIIVDEKR